MTLNVSLQRISGIFHVTQNKRLGVYNNVVYNDMKIWPDLQHSTKTQFSSKQQNTFALIQ